MPIPSRFSRRSSHSRLWVDVVACDLPVEVFQFALQELDFGRPSHNGEQMTIELPPRARGDSRGRRFGPPTVA